jgi:NAD(P)-dependent dehydrogenase (short-subunit alcohol dehydrogenase family)
VSGPWAGRVVAVAGCARPPGIGFATALRLAARGATVACLDAVGPQPEGGYDTGIVSAELLEEVARDVGAAGGGEALAVPVDPFHPEAWEEAAATVVDRLGRIDVCCALMGTTGPTAGDGVLLDVPLASWQRCYDVNVLAPLLFGRACARDMLRREAAGSIVFLSSYSAVVPPAGNGAVASARAALNTITETMAVELAGRGIRVNAVQPLSVRSEDPRFPNPGLSRLADRKSDTFSSWVHAQVPLGRPQRADETAAAVEFLCSDEASFITGVSLPVAGGAHSHS